MFISMLFPFYKLKRRQDRRILPKRRWTFSSLSKRYFFKTVTSAIHHHSVGGLHYGPSFVQFSVAVPLLSTFISIHFVTLFDDAIFGLLLNHM